jgi:hypothetical protein
MPGQEMAPKGSLFFAAKHAECARSPGEAKRDAPANADVPARRYAFPSDREN